MIYICNVQIRRAPVRGYGDHQPTAHPDGDRLLSELPRLPVQAEW